MIDYQLISNFFTRYGSKIETEDTQKNDFGILAPVKDLEAGLGLIRYGRTGYQMKSEYLLLTLNQSGIVYRGTRLKINEQTFYVLNTDYYYYANKPLYLRAYLAKAEEIDEKGETV